VAVYSTAKFASLGTSTPSRSCRALRKSSTYLAKATPGFTTVVGLAYRHNRAYALELSTDPGNPAPGTGKIVRLDGSGSIEDVVIGLTLPTAMTFGSDDNLYVSNFGAAGLVWGRSSG
jgi:hypothetical protein